MLHLKCEVCRRAIGKARPLNPKDLPTVPAV
jgi:hypothetical protein